MIEVTQAHENADYKVVVDGAPLCTVAVVYGPGRYGYHGPDWPATKARAEAIATALRHYQQSQEGDRVP